MNNYRESQTARPIPGPRDPSALASGGSRPPLAKCGIPLFTLCLLAAATVLQLSPSLAETLQYDRAAVAGGEWWRVFTGHWTHWSFDHFLWDAGMLAVLGLAGERIAPRWARACLAASAVAVPLLVLWWSPETELYRGLSGIDSAMFLFLAATLALDFAERRDWPAALLVAAVTIGFAAKIAFETVTSRTVFVHSAAAEMVPLPAAHLAGALVGLAVGAARIRTAVRPHPKWVECPGRPL